MNIKPKPWYLQNGTRYPEPAPLQNSSENFKHLFPFEGNANDRIVNQLMYVPPNYNKNKEIKTILSANGIIDWWRVKEGTDLFSNLKCPVDRCRLTANYSEQSTADMVLFHDHLIPTNKTRPPNQIYALYYTESPLSSFRVSIPSKVFIFFNFDFLALWRF